MTLVVPPETNEDVDFFATRGFGGAGISKIGGAIQAGRLAYRTSKWAYRRYFGYATRTRSRTIGTSTGSGIGIGSGLVAIWQTPHDAAYQNRQARNYLVKSKSKRKRCYVRKPSIRR